jgi:uncharacterized protein (TIGR04255 family)
MPTTEPHPPIVEAIVDIDCELPPGVTLTDLETAACDSLRDNYPQLQKRLLQQFQIRQQGDAAPEHELKDGGLDTLLFRSEDSRQLTQFRSSGYSFNRLAPYEGMDVYLPEIKRTWENYCAITHPLRIGKIGLRTINRIALPLNVEGGVELETYLKTGPRLPQVPGRALSFTGFLNQHQLLDSGTGHQANIALAIEGKKEEKLILILDIDVFDLKPRETLEWTEIVPVIESLRNLKNELFFNILTKECLNLYTCQS